MKYKITVNGKDINDLTKKERRAYDATKKANLKEMLESGCAPMMGCSDRMFLQDRHATQGLDHVFAERYIAAARKAGINTTGKVYMSQLARKGLGPRTPEAWVSGVDDVKTACKMNGHGSEKLGLKPVIKDPEPDVPLAPDIVEEFREKEIKENPDLAHADQRELTEKIVDKHSRRK